MYNHSFERVNLVDFKERKIGESLAKDRDI